MSITPNKPVCNCLPTFGMFMQHWGSKSFTCVRNSVLCKIWEHSFLISRKLWTKWLSFWGLLWKFAQNKNTFSYFKKFCKSKILVSRDIFGRNIFGTARPLEPFLVGFVLKSFDKCLHGGQPRKFYKSIPLKMSLQ